MAESLLQQLKKTKRLPSPPGAALRILQLCQKEDVDIVELADTVSADPALSLRLLKYANSSLLGVRREVTNVRDAVLMLGLRSVRLMALSFSLISNDEQHVCEGFDYGLFWSHSAACAVAARYLAKQRGEIAPEEAFATGLLAHVGRLVFALAMPREYAAILSECDGYVQDAAAGERERIGYSHEDIGADLMEDWGVPMQLAQVVRYQNDPESLAETPPLDSLARIIQVATAIADMMCGSVCEASFPSRREVVLNTWSFESPAAADAAIEQIRVEFEDMARVLSLRQGATSRAKEIQAEAGVVLGELSLAAQLKSEAVERENRGLQEKAWTDGLTGLNNRACFDKELRRLWNECARKGHSLALILLDIDHFKKFNDTFGHRTGDEVLKRVAQGLAKAVRKTDFSARYGGEEFVVIVPNVDRMTAAHVAVKIRRGIETTRVDFEDRQHQVTVSVGTALLLVPEAPFTPENLIEAADRQLYNAKHKGRNCCSMKQLQPDGYAVGAMSTATP